METVYAAIVAAIGLVLVALINRTRQHAKAAREQLDNAHIDEDGKIPNIRENIDHNHVKILEHIESFNEKLDGVIDTQRRQTNKLDRLFSITGKHNKQIDEILKEKEE